MSAATSRSGSPRRAVTWGFRRRTLFGQISPEMCAPCPKRSPHFWRRSYSLPDPARIAPRAAQNSGMDNIVRQAIAKWPKVPDCYGWLGLDARGNWYMRDDRVQASGPFAAPDAAGSLVSKGSLLRHEKLIDFIGRNYECDASGQWFFQNGPQRVYVELQATPLIWRIDAAPSFAVTAHTGQSAHVQRCIVDEQGRV